VCSKSWLKCSPLSVRYSWHTINKSWRTKLPSTSVTALPSTKASNLSSFKALGTCGARSVNDKLKTSTMDEDDTGDNKITAPGFNTLCSDCTLTLRTLPVCCKSTPLITP